MLVSKASSILATKTVPFARTVVLRSQAGVSTRAFSAIASTNTSSPLLSSDPTRKPIRFPLQQPLTLPRNKNDATRRFQSSQADITHQQHRGTVTVTKQLRVLNMDVVKQILSELRDVDVNSDGRIDTDELKQLLRKHNSAFTEEEIFEIGELFYAGKSGGSVPFDRFVEAIDRVVQYETQDSGPNQSGAIANVKDLMDIGSCGNEYLFYKSHGNYSKDELDIKLTHTEPQGFRDRLAFNAVKYVRKGFDWATGWSYNKVTPDMVLQRVIYLETIAAVPGMVAAIVRHFRSLRTMQRDGGMMQMFLDEANNERMHLLTFVRMKDPSRVYRAMVIAGQFGFGSLFGLAYVISPKFCHRFVGYVEEEACATYTKIIGAIENAEPGTELAEWRMQLAPRIARSYWKLGEQGTVLEMMYSIRADEAEHRDVNHLCSSMDGEGMTNPVSNTEQHLNTMLLKYVKDIMDRTPDVQRT